MDASWFLSTLDIHTVITDEIGETWNKSPTRMKSAGIVCAFPEIKKKERKKLT